MARSREIQTGTFDLPLPPQEAFEYVTPEGERMWVPDWDPKYPDGAASESVGTVFVTNAGGVQSVWVIVAFDREAASATYTRITPGRHAGSVAVRCDQSGEGHSRVTVRYDITTLAPDDPDVLATYRRPAFDAMLEEWRELIAEHSTAAATSDGARAGRATRDLA